MPHQSVESTHIEYETPSTQSVALIASLEARLHPHESEQGESEQAAAPEAAPLDVTAERQNVAAVHADTETRKKLPDMTIREIGQMTVEKSQQAITTAKTQAATRTQRVKESPRTTAVVDNVRSTFGTASRMLKAAREAAVVAPAAAPQPAPKKVETVVPAPKIAEKAAEETPAQQLQREISAVIKPEDYTKAIEQALQTSQVNADTFMNLLDHKGIDRRTANNLVKLMQTEGKLTTDTRHIRVVEAGSDFFLEGNYATPVAPVAVKPRTLGGEWQPAAPKEPTPPKPEQTQPVAVENTDDAQAVFDKRGYELLKQLEAEVEPDRLKAIMDQVKTWQKVSERELEKRFKDVSPEVSRQLMQWMTYKNVVERFGRGGESGFRVAPNAPAIIKGALLRTASASQAVRLPGAAAPTTQPETITVDRRSRWQRTMSDLKRYFTNTPAQQRTPEARGAEQPLSAKARRVGGKLAHAGYVAARYALLPDEARANGEPIVTERTRKTARAAAKVTVRSLGNIATANHPEAAARLAEAEAARRKQQS